MKGAICYCTIATLLGGGVASADPGDTLMTVRNDYYRTVGVWVRSEKNQNPNPWVHQTIAARTDAKFTLRSPDRYIIVVDMDNQRSRSKPVELKAFLNKHPDFVMNLSVQQLAGAGEGSSGSLGGALSGSVSTPNDNDNSEAAHDVLYLEFSPEPQNR